MTSDEFKQMAFDLLELVEKQERGEISEFQLLRAWKQFMRQASLYFEELNKQIKIN